MNKFYKFSRLAVSLAVITLVTGCVGGGGGLLGNSGTYGLGSTTTNSSSGGLQDTIINAII